MEDGFQKVKGWLHVVSDGFGSDLTSSKCLGVGLKIVAFAYCHVVRGWHRLPVVPYKESVFFLVHRSKFVFCILNYF